jgi:hypothetical protein
MGWGDYIVTTGLVRRLKKQNPSLQILIQEPFNETSFYKDVFYKNPYVTDIKLFDDSKPHIKIPRILVGQNDENNRNKISWSNERVAEVGNFYQKEEEINFTRKCIDFIKDHWIDKNKKKPKGIIFISDKAKKSAIIDNININYDHSNNKEWGDVKWNTFIRICSHDYIIIKTSPEKEDTPDGLYNITCDFRTCYSIMKECNFFIGNHGGHSHLWAVTKKKGIVFYGHWFPPHIAGYPFHINLTTNNHCGSLVKCEECINFYNNLEPEYIKFLLDKNIN